MAADPRQAELLYIDEDDLEHEEHDMDYSPETNAHLGEESDSDGI